MKKTILAFIATAATLGAVTAHAAEPGPYLGIGGVYAKNQYNIANDTTSGDKKSNKVGGKIYGGYQFDKNFAIEAGYTQFGKKKYDYTVGSESGSVEAKAKSFYIAGKAAYPINEQFSVFGKLGVGRNKNDVNAYGLAANLNNNGNKTALYAAVGAEYMITPKFGLEVSYERYGKNKTDQGRKNGAFGFGARYHF